MLYSSTEAAPARLAALLRTVQFAGPLTAERLENLLQPPGVRVGGKASAAVRDNLQLALDLGLLRSSSDHPPQFHVADASTNDDTLMGTARRLLGKDLPVVDPAAPNEYYQF